MSGIAQRHHWQDRTMRADQAYAELMRLSREETLLGSCSDLLEWDEEVFMPPGGVEHRAEQLALLAGMLHEKGCDPRLDELLAIVEQSDLVQDPESDVAVNVRELRREFDRERRLPTSLVEESARVAALAAAVWVEARQAADFSLFAPWLDTIFRLAREEAAAVGYPDVPYDALLEDYEPGVTTRDVAALFDWLRPELLALLDRVRGAPLAVPGHILRREFPVDRQRLFAEAVAAALGFDLEAGRLDPGKHPFCMAVGPGDTRIALRFDSRDFPSGFFVLLHEVGHALYDQGLEPAHYGTPLGDAPSKGLHESQSRLWENLVGRSPGFWRHFYPRVRNIFHEALHDVGEEAFLRVLNRVEPGVQRARADEITYNLHIIIRFELEQALLSGDLRARDLPAAWDEGHRKYLGVTPGNPVEGCLQDGHWAEGMIGYFPSYALGNVYAAQLYDAAGRDLGDLDTAFARGDFTGLLGWLRDKVHRHGQRYPVRQLLERATGSPPRPEALVESLRRRYLAP
jgi:carboxypeptidase Taq